MAKRINKLYMYPCVTCGVERPTRKCRFGTKCVRCLGRSPKNTPKWEAQGVANVSKDPLYTVWYSMKQRCYRKQQKDYPRYGGRGITVCEEWRSDALVFIQWSRANGYEKGLEIDRKDNDGPYAPENCQWITPTENVRKSSATKLCVDIIPAISLLIRAGVKDSAIAGVAGVHRRTISDIRRGITWSDISGLGATASA